MKYRNIIMFLVLASCNILLLESMKKILGYDTLLYNSLSEKLTQSQIEAYVNFLENWKWVSYVVSPLILFIKLLIIAAIIDVGCFFFNKKIGYKKIFHIVTQAEFVFLLVGIFKTGWFYFFQQDYVFEDLQYFYPLSALSIVGHEGLQAWFIYPLQILNLFELAYWFILAYLIGSELKTTTEWGLNIVMSSYGVGLLVWVVGVMFFILNVS